MLLASYHGQRKEFIHRAANNLIKWRTDGDYSHTEVVFEPGDGVDHLMPDGTCEPDANGWLWCASSTGTDRLPQHSRRRAGKIGGVRFKRINVHDQSKWSLRKITKIDAIKVATWFVLNEGALYAWNAIFGNVAWLIQKVYNTKEARYICSGSIMAAFGFRGYNKFDPYLIDVVCEHL